MREVTSAMSSQLAASHYHIFSITTHLLKEDTSDSVMAHTHQAVTRELDWGCTHDATPFYE